MDNALIRSRIWWCVALIPGIAVTWWFHCRDFRHNVRGEYDPPGWEWEVGLAWLYWKTWYWWDGEIK